MCAAHKHTAMAGNALTIDKVGPSKRKKTLLRQPALTYIHFYPLFLTGVSTLLSSPGILETVLTQAFAQLDELHSASLSLSYMELHDSDLLDLICMAGTRNTDRNQPVNLMVAAAAHGSNTPVLTSVHGPACVPLNSYQEAQQALALIRSHSSSWAAATSPSHHPDSPPLNSAHTFVQLMLRQEQGQATLLSTLTFVDLAAAPPLSAQGPLTHKQMGKGEFEQKGGGRCLGFSASRIGFMHEVWFGETRCKQVRSNPAL